MQILYLLNLIDLFIFFHLAVNVFNDLIDLLKSPVKFHLIFDFH